MWPAEARACSRLLTQHRVDERPRSSRCSAAGKPRLCAPVPSIAAREWRVSCPQKTRSRMHRAAAFERSSGRWTLCRLLAILLSVARGSHGQLSGVTGVTVGSREVNMRVQFEVEEEQAPDTLIGFIPTKPNFTYRFNEGPAAFRLNGSTGAITTSFRIDRECLLSDRFDLIILSSQPTYPIEVRVVVVDINDNSPIFPEPFLQVAFSENASPGTRVILDTATDADIGVNDITTDYRIVSGNEDGRFHLVVTTNPSGETPFLHLETTAHLDREVHTHYTLNISARDGGTVPRFGYVTVNVTVLDVNDNPPIFDHSDYSVSLNESVPPGTSVLQVRATDSDSGDNALVTYYLSDMETQFTVDPQTGLISTADSLSCQQHCATPSTCHKSCVFTVLARDHGSPRQDGRAYVTVNLLDANDHDPIIRFRFFPSAATYATVDENAQNGSVVAAVSVIDYDEGSNGETVVEIQGGNEDCRFRLESSASFDLVRVHGILDRELVGKYNLTITATDKGVPSRSSTAFLIIHVNDVNDHEPIFQKSEYSAVLSEAVPEGSFVASITATDEDTGINSNIIYSLASGNDKRWFTIDAVSGLVTTATRINREEADLVELKVSARDGGPSPRWAHTYLRVQVLDVNDERPNFYTPSVNVTLAENVPPSSVVAVLSASDDDLGSNGSVTYALHESVGSRYPDTFSVDPSYGRVVTTSPLDRETLSLYTLLVVAEDQGIPPLSSTATIHLTVMDVDDNSPFFYPKLYFANISYNAPVGTLVAKVEAHDADEGPNARIIYSLASGAEGKFKVDENGAIHTTASFGTRPRSRYELLVSANNPGDQNSQEMALVYVYVWTGRTGMLHFDRHSNGFHFSLEEDADKEEPMLGRHVGQVTVAAPQGHRVRYAIVDGDPTECLRIDEISGVISTARKIDRESQPRFSLTVVGFDLLTFSLIPVHILVTDTNDCPPKFDVMPEVVDVPENFPPGREIWRVHASDADDGSIHGIQYRLSANPLQLFAIDSESGMLYVNKSLRWQHPGWRHDLEVTAEDGGDPPLSSRLQFAIQVTDVNDHTPTFSHTSYETSVMESVKVNERFFSLSATDADLGENGHISYEIVGGNEEHRFGIFPDGAVYVKSALDREKRDFYSITILARDNGTKSRDSAAVLSIHVMDENDNRPKFENDSFVFYVAENDPPDTYVGRLIAEDADRDRNAELTFSLSSNQNEFLVDPKSGLIKTLQSLDREKLRQSTGHDFFVLEALVTDNGITRLRSEAKITIYVTDVNDNPPVFVRAPYHAAVSEGAALRALVIRLATTDADEGINGHVIYSLSAGNEEGCFQVDESSGQITLVRTLDRERATRYQLVVVARDLGEVTSHSASATVLVDVLDENDNAPEFGPCQKESILEESVPVGHLVSVFTASDPDLGRNGDVSFNIASGNTKETFRIDTNSGAVYVARRLDYEEQRSFILNITASDGGAPRLSTTVQLTVHVIDINDNPPTFPTVAIVRQIEEGLPTDSPVVMVTAEDRDSLLNGRVSYSIVRQDPPGEHFAIRPDTGLIVTSRNIDREFSDTFRLTVVAVDQAEPESSRLSAEKSVTVIVEDVNDNSPTFVSVDAGVFPRGARKGHVIMTLTAEDPDANMNGAVTYDLVEGNAELFSVRRNSGQLHLLSQVEEPEVAYFLTVQATDEASGPYRKSSRSKIIVLGASESGRGPTFDSREYRASVPENSPVGTSVLQVRAQSTTGHEMEYFVTGVSSESGGVQRRKFGINRNTGVISTTTPIDREAGAHAYILEVYAADTQAATPSTAATKVIISVLDLNDNPPLFLDGPYEVSFSEDTPAGSTVCVVSASDLDSEANVSYKLIDDEEIFRLDMKTGVLLLHQPLDREMKPRHALLIMADDGIQSSQTTVTIEVIDTNDNPPQFTEQVYSFDVPEDVQRGAQVGMLSALDVDLGVNSHISYTVISDWGNDVFSLNPQTGVFTLTSRLDYEQVQHYIFVVQAQDSGQPSLSSTVTVYFNVLDLNDNAPLFDPMSYSDEIYENITIGSSILKVSATDLDSDENGKMIFNIIEGDTYQQFAITSNGTILTTKLLDREKQSFYSLSVSASDLALPEEQRLTSTVQVTIVLKDVNDRAPEFVMPNTTSIMENVPLNTVIMAVKALDKDEGRNSYVEYSMVPHSDSQFMLGPVDGLLRVSGFIDREMKSQHRITVIAKDRGYPTQSTSITITVDVTDENDNRPVFDPRQYVSSVSENASIGHSILKVRATDLDDGINAQIRYSIVAGDLNRDFLIGEDTGSIYVGKSLDYERQSHYILTVQAEDSGHDVHYDTATVMISIIDVNDNPPAFLHSPYEIHVMENLRLLPVSLVTLTAEDADMLPDNQIHYMIKDGNKKLFKMNSISGEIVLQRSLDREKESEFELIVLAIDSGNPRQTGTGTVSIIVNDMNDNFPVFQHNQYIATLAENQPPDFPVVTVSATDADIGPNGLVRYSLLDESGKFSVDSVSGNIRTKVILDREERNRYELVLVAHDSGLVVKNSAQVNVTVMVEDVNDHQPQFREDNYVAYIPDTAIGGHYVFGANAEDKDVGANSRLVYHLSGSDADKFHINQDTGVVLLMERLVNRSGGYQLEIQVTDSGLVPLSSKAKLTVYIQPNQLFPFFLTGSRNFVFPEGTENQLLTTVSATLSNSRPATALSYKISGGNIGNSFAVGASTGAIHVISGLDHETLPRYDLWIEASDSGLPPLATAVKLEIQVTDENDNAPVFAKDVLNATVREELSPPQLVTVVHAIDVDSGRNGEIRYHILPTESESLFSIDDRNGKIYTKVQLDREETDIYWIIVAAVDQGLPEQSSTATVVVTVLDKNDNPPRFSRLFSVNVTENASLGSFVIQVTSSDRDIDENANATYSFTDNPDGKFHIDAITGNVTVAGYIDRESRDEYLLKVAAVDGSWRAETPLTISVQDLNDNAPEFNRDTYNFNFPELRSPQSFVGQVAATDRDKHGPNSVIFYHFKRPSAFFHINSSSGAIVSKQLLYYRRTTKGPSPINEHFLQVVATDHGRPPMSSQVNVVVTVVDTNNNPPQFEQEDYHSPVTEHSAVGVSLLHVKAVDELDEGINAKIIYFITGGNGSHYFSINNETGLITVRRLLLNHRGHTFILRVQAEDVGIPPKAASTTVHITVTGDNQYSPVFTALSYQVIVSEGEALHSVVISVTATDADEGLNGEVVYSLISGDAEGHFSIDKNRGSVSVIKPLDYEIKKDYQLNITAADKGFQSKEASAMLTIIITDINDNPPAFNSSSFAMTIKENEPPGIYIDELVATDPDSNRNAVIQYSIAGDDAKEAFEINSATGVITSKISFNYEEKNSYVFDVVASNIASPLFTTTKAVVHVIGVNEFHPHFIQPIFQFSVSEISQIGTTVGKLKATDEDEGLDGQIFFFLVGSSNDQGFHIQSDSGVITVSQKLDRESQARVVLTVMAKNAGSIRGNDTDEAQLVINIEDGNDPPVFSKQLYIAHVSEEAPLGTSVITVFAHDTDVQPDNSQFSFSVLNGETAAFTIDPQYGLLQTAAALDRETVASYNLTVVAVDSGNPPQTGTAMVHVIVDDVNDNGPTFHPSEVIGYVSENEPSFTSVMILSATDPDQPINGAPFMYFLVGGEHKDFFEVDRHTGLIKTTRSLDRESMPRTKLIVEVHDNGTPPMKSRHFVSVTVTDTNDCPSAPRALSVFVWIFGSAFAGGMIADVHPLDPDTTGKYLCRITEGNTSVFKIPNSCELHVTKLHHPKNYTLTVIGNDSKHPNVTSTIRIQFMNFTNKTIENSITIRVLNTSANDFLTHQYERFQKVLQEILQNAAGLPMIYSITSVARDLELTLAVRQGHQYLNPVDLISLLSSKKNLLNEVVEQTTLGYNSCSRKPCLNSGKCSSFLQLQKEFSITDSPSLVITSPTLRQHFFCSCAHGFSGPLCQYQENACSPNPCLSGGTCSHDGQDFNCICPQKFEGKVCELAKASSCISSPCRFGGTCKEAPNGSFFCICRPGFRGAMCEHPSDGCRPNRCLNGGTCISDKPGYHCVCEISFFGRHCEHSAYGFYPYSFMAFASLDSSTNDVAIVFATNKANALLVYNHGQQTGGRSDFFALEVVEGKPVFSFGGARTAIAILRLKRTVSDGKWHKITVIRNGKVASLSVVDCIENGEMCDSCFPNNVSCSLSLTGHTGTLNFNGNPMYVGGVPSVDPIVERPGQVTTDDFVGCIQSISVNGRLLDLSKPLRTRHTTANCGRKSHACSSSSGTCGGGGKCTDQWFSTTCHCTDDIISPNCNEALAPFSFGVGGSFVELVPLEKHRRAQILTSTTFQSRDKGKRAASPVRHTKWLSVMFRTQTQNGLLLYSVTDEDYTLLQLEKGQVFYYSQTSRSQMKELIRHESLSDGQWHTVRLEMDQRSDATINISIDSHWSEIRADSLHDFLDPYLTSLTLGGHQQKGFVAENAAIDFQGCMKKITINGEIQALNATDSYFQRIHHGKVQNGCSDEALGIDLAPTDPLNIGIILVIVFFVILIVVILISFVMFRRRKLQKEKNPLQAKHNGGGFLASMSADIPRNHQDSLFVGGASTEDILRNHIAQDLLPKKMEREGNIERPQRPDIIDREVMKSSAVLAPRIDDRCLHENSKSQGTFSMHHLVEPEVPEHYDLENASSIAPSDIDICYHYKGFRDGNVHKYKTNPHVPNYHKHNHRHSPHQFQPSLQRDSPHNILHQTSNHTRESPSTLKMQNTPLARLSPSSELSQQTPRILTLQDISGKPLQTALLATSQGVGPNSERSLTSPVSQLTSSIRSGPQPGKNGKDSILALGLTAEEIERLNARPRNSSLVSTLDAVSTSSDDNPEKNKLAELLETNTELLEAADSSTDESGNDSFTCSEFEYDNNYDKVHRDFSPGNMIFSKLTEEDNENDEDSAKTYDGFDSFRGSLSTLVASDDDLSNLSSYKPANGSLLGWDYLLNWGPNFQNLVGVFKDIAELPDSMQHTKASEQYV